MTRSRYRIFETSYPYFLTDTIVSWLPVFDHSFAVDVIADSWRYLQREQGVKIYGYVVMKDHVHWIASADDLAEQVGRFKSFTARRIIDELKSRSHSELLRDLQSHKLKHKSDQRHQLWQEGSHPQQIQNAEIMRQKLDYIHANPVRRGYVDHILDWRYSSALNYAGLNGLIEVAKDRR